MGRIRVGVLVCFGLAPLIAGASDATAPTANPPMCPSIPAGDPLIGGLASGQVLSSGQGVTLRFSNREFACGSWLTEISSQGCRDDWAFSLTLPQSSIQPGTYNLAALSAQFGDLFGTAGPPPAHAGCGDSCSMSANGMGPHAVTDPGATLVVYSSDAQCVTGKLSGLKDPTFPEAPDYNGAFFAIQCSQ